MSIKHELAGRVGFVYLFVILLSVAIGVKALHVQVLEGEKWREKSRTISAKDLIVPPNRGDICSDDALPLASSVPYYTLYFDGLAVTDTLFANQVDSLAFRLSHFFGDASKALYREKLWNGRYGSKPNRYLRINSRKVSYTELKVIKTFPIFREPGSKSGLILKRENVRVRPRGNLAERTIGYLNEDKDGTFEGRVGIEGAYEQVLKGKNGHSIQQMMSGRWVAVTVEDPVDGHDVITTINTDYQDIVQHALLKQLEHFRADAGTAILMEVKTGDIKAIANLSKTSKGYREVLNMAISDAAEPGSVFKAAVMIALMEDGYVHPNDTIDLGNRGQYRFGRHVITESNGRAMGKVTVKQIFERSSNGISVLVDSNYKAHPGKFIKRLYDMQLNEMSGIELVGEGAPYIKELTDKSWSRTTLPSMSIGYELKVTPLQVLAFYNTLANDGKRVKPRLVKEIRHRGNVIKRFPVEVVNRSICSAKTLSYIREMMEGVVENGTARNLHGTSCKIAGKTGTARIADGSKGYANPKYRASFVGYFPAEAPLYSCIVVVENPSQNVGYYGNVVSGNVFREISDRVYALASLKYRESEEGEPQGKLPVSKNGLKQDFLAIYDHLKIPVKEDQVGTTEWITTTREEEAIDLKPRDVNLATIPNVRGMGLRDALYLLESAGLKVGVSGSGSVVNQSLRVGDKVNRGSYIHVELR